MVFFVKYLHSTGHNQKRFGKVDKLYGDERFLGHENKKKINLCFKQIQRSLLQTNIKHMLVVGMAIN